MYKKPRNIISKRSSEEQSDELLVSRGPQTQRVCTYSYMSIYKF